MSINLKEVNHAEEKIVVGGIKVLGSMEGPGVVSIKQNIDSLTNAVNTIGQKQEDYWSSIASDNIITPVEKKTLKKEWSTIQTTYTSILQMATEKGILDTEDVKLYKKYYGELYDYLFKTIKVFDNMGENTGIPSISQYAQVYNNYYDQETIVQTILAASSSTFTVRNLTSLEETGTPNEIAMYNGQFYRYNAGLSKWEYVSAGKYKGLMSDIPDNVIDDYFLAASNFNKTMALKTSKGILTTSDGTVITIVKKFVKGYLYECTVNGWRIISNRNDYRYIIATNDLVLNGDAISPKLDEATRETSYCGSLEDLPNNYKSRDFFLYRGNTREISYGSQTTTFEKGCIYYFNNPLWQKLDTTDAKNNKMFMAALNDLLEFENATDGYFATAFINNLIANESFIKKLATQVITLSQDPDHTDETGIIQSDNYKTSEGTEGFRLNYDGTADFKGNTHIGGILTVDGEAEFGRDTVFKGTLQSPALYVQQKEITYTFTAIGTEQRYIIEDMMSRPWSGLYNNESVVSLGYGVRTGEERIWHPSSYSQMSARQGSVEIISILTIKTTGNTYTVESTRVVETAVVAGSGSEQRVQNIINIIKADAEYESVRVNISFTGEFSLLSLGIIPISDPKVKGAFYVKDNALYISEG